MKPVKNNHVKFAVCRRAPAVAIACIAVMFLAGTAWPYANMKKQPIGGPWEIVVQSGRGALQFPVEVPDENKPAKLNSVFPIMGTAVKIKLEKYLPDLKWETYTVEHPDGGIVAKLTVSGKDLNQELWLNSDNPAKSSISSSIGSVAIRKLHNASTVEEIVRELSLPETVGVVTVWAEDSNTPSEYVVGKTGTIEIADTKYKLSILEYIPHYSVDTQTKKVGNLSAKPVNPAIKISFNDGAEKIERWLWSKFPSAPHMGTDPKKAEFPVRMEFIEFDLAGEQGRYILTAAPGSDAWMLLQGDGKTNAERIQTDCSYPFADKAYSFTVDRIAAGATVKTYWKNNSEKLLNPAVAATVEYSDMKQEAVLELNKPYHCKTESGTMIFLYRRRVSSSGGTD